MSESLQGAHWIAIVRYRNLLLSVAAAPLALSVDPFLTLTIAGICAAAYTPIAMMPLLEGTLRDLRGAYAFKRKRIAEPSGTAETKSNKAFGIADIDRKLRQFASAFLGYDGSLQGFRIVYAIALILHGMVWVVRVAPFDQDVKVFDGIPHWRWFWEVPWLAAMIEIALGVTLMDWVAVRLFWRAISRISIWTAAKFLALLVGAVGGVLLVVALTLVFLLRFFGNVVLEWLFFAQFAIVFGILAVTIFALTRGAYRYAVDSLMFSKIALGDRMARTDIASAVESLRTRHWRLALVRRLNHERVAANGYWPSTFKLLVTSDPVVTELAKLEERWLRLDR
jgi:hypothetical protein